MRRDRLGRDRELVRDLGVRPPDGDEPRDVVLAGRQRRPAFGAGAAVARRRAAARSPGRPSAGCRARRPRTGRPPAPPSPRRPVGSAGGRPRDPAAPRSPPRSAGGRPSRESRRRGACAPGRSRRSRARRGRDHGRSPAPASTTPLSASTRSELFDPGRAPPATRWPPGGPESRSPGTGRGARHRRREPTRRVRGRSARPPPGPGRQGARSPRGPRAAVTPGGCRPSRSPMRQRLAQVARRPPRAGRGRARRSRGRRGPVIRVVTPPRPSRSAAAATPSASAHRPVAHRTSPRWAVM